MTAFVEAQEKDGVAIVSVAIDATDEDPQSVVREALARLVANSRFRLIIVFHSNIPNPLDAILKDVEARVLRRRGWVRVVTPHMQSVARLTAMGLSVSLTEESALENLHTE